MSPEELEKLYLQGGDAYNSGDYEKAVRLYSKVVKEDPFAHEEATYWLADSYYQQGDLDNARHYYKESIKIIPEHEDSYNGIGITYYDEGEYDQAKKSYHKALELNPNAHYVIYNLSLIERAEKNQEAEEEYLKKCLELRPNYIDALNALGNIYYARNEYDLAKEYYKKCVRANPDYKYPYYNLALIAENDLEYQKARKYYLRAIEADSNYTLAINGLREIEEKLRAEGELFDEAPLEDDDFDGLPGANPIDGEQPSNESRDTEETPEDKLKYFNRVGRNLNQLATEGKLPALIGREEEMQAIFEVLFKRFKNNPVLLGHPGVGKTVIVEGIAQKIVDGKAPAPFKDKVLIEINIGGLVAGTKYRGEMETKVKRIIEEAKANPDIILFIDEIHTLIGAGETEGSNLDMAQMLKPALARGEITCIGATTLEEYRKYFEKDPALSRRFYPIRIEEPKIDDVKQILVRMMPQANEYYGVELTEENISEIVDLSAQHIKNRFFPDKAIDVMEKLAARNGLKGNKKIGSKEIKEIISELTGIQFSEEYGGEMEKLQHLEDILKKKVFGQDQAIEALSNIIRISKRRLDLQPERPDGVFLFTGPTGVGKTYLAKCLAEVLFGDPKKLLRVDMSEFMDKYSVSRLLGSAPGYIGYDETPGLTKMVEENPSAVLLLDEIEKAHPDIIKIFLQIFDEGHVTDSRNKKVFFSDITIIMTSNAMIRAKQSLGFGAQNETLREDEIVDQLSGSFPKELLNRIDEIVVFNSLQPDDVEHILTAELYEKTTERFAREGIQVSFDPSVGKKVIAEGYSLDLGARNLNRAFDRLVLSPLVRAIYDQHLDNSAVRISYENDEFKATKI